MAEIESEIRFSGNNHFSIDQNIKDRFFPIELAEPEVGRHALEVFHAYADYYADGLHRYIEETESPWIPVGEMCGIPIVANKTNEPIAPFPRALVIRVQLRSGQYDESYAQLQQYAGECADSPIQRSPDAKWMPVDFEFPDDPRMAAQTLIDYCLCTDQQKVVLDDYKMNYDNSSTVRPKVDQKLLDAALVHFLGEAIYPIQIAKYRDAKNDLLDASSRKRFGACTVTTGGDYAAMLVFGDTVRADLRNFFRSRSKDRSKKLVQIPCSSEIVYYYTDIDPSKSGVSSVERVDIKALQNASSNGIRAASRKSPVKANSAKLLRIDSSDFRKHKSLFSSSDKVARFILKGSGSSANGFGSHPPAHLGLLWILEMALRLESSDIHIEQYDSSTYMSRVRLRIDGKNNHLMSLSTEAHARLNGVLKNYSGISSDKAISGNGRIDISHSELGLYYGRLQAIPGNNGNANYEQDIVIRLARRDASGADLTLNQIGFEPEDLAIFKRAINRPYGINIICGPTGSGKTTTIYAALEERNKPNIKIITAENPIEREIPGVCQVDTGIRDDLNFTSILNDMLRSDPDVIQVGEIRDKTEAQLAINATLTGHLIFTTLHTQTAVGAIPRLLEIGIPADMLAESINIIQAQRLVRRVCKKCAIPRTPTPEEMEEFREARIDIRPNQKIYDANPNGCNDCREIGYNGRCMIVEILPFIDEIKDAILDVRQIGVSQVTRKISELSKSYGLRNLYQNGLIKVANGVTTMEEVSGWNTNWLNLKKLD